MVAATNGVVIPTPQPSKTKKKIGKMKNGEKRNHNRKRELHFLLQAVEMYLQKILHSNSHLSPNFVKNFDVLRSQGNCCSNVIGDLRTQPRFHRLHPFFIICVKLISEKN